MVNTHKQLIWALAACAAVVAQVTPKPPCHACDQPCCAGQAMRHGPKTADSTVEPAGGCPQCGTKADPRPAETTKHPCRCQLDVRQEQPSSLPRGILTAVADDAPAHGLTVLPQVVPQELGVSREYVATSLTVPIRPTRILFGVWRN